MLQQYGPYFAPIIVSIVISAIFKGIVRLVGYIAVIGFLVYAYNHPEETKEKVSSVANSVISKVKNNDTGGF